jgi:hypothetical protein
VVGMNVERPVENAFVVVRLRTRLLCGNPNFEFWSIGMHPKPWPIGSLLIELHDGLDDSRIRWVCVVE